MTGATQIDLHYHLAARKNIAGIIRLHSTEQLNRIPEGFNNNLIWNAGHVIATCELLTYALAGHHTPSGRAFIDRYRKGSKPEGDVDQQEVDFILNELALGHERLGKDISSLDWSKYKPYETSFGVTLKDIHGAIAFNNLHEAMHLGSMIALKKFV